MRASFHLGNALRSLGEYQQARKINEETLGLMRRELGESHEDTLRTSNSYAADLRLVGHFKEALAIDDDLLRRYRDLGENEATTLRSANNLAVDYRLLGDFQRAYEIDSENLERRRAVLRDDSSEVLSSVASVARDLYGIGDYYRSLEEAEKCVQTYHDQFKDHMFYLIALRNYAIILRKVGRHADAVGLSVDIRDLSQSRLGPRHEHSLSAMMTLANALRMTDSEENLLPAEEIAGNVLRLYEEGFGANHPFTLACAINRGIIWRALNRVDDALAFDRATLDSLKGVLGDNHPYTLCALTSLSNNLSMAGDHAEARLVSQDVYDRSRRARPEDHPYTLACATNLAVDLEATGATAEAATLRLDTKRRLQHTLGREHPSTVNMERGRRAECDIEVPPT
jgi:tetratricopeptide (TPR) repeat protein